MDKFNNPEEQRLLDMQTAIAALKVQMEDLSAKMKTVQDRLQAARVL